MAGSGTAHLRPAGETLLRVEHLVVEFPIGKSGLKVNAVSEVSLDIKEGETLGLVGESGCGKSTLARAAIQLPPPTSGKVLFEGQDLTKLKGEALRRVRPRMQMIFQDPISSLNPRRKIGDLVGEGLEIWGIGDKAVTRQQKVDEVLDAVGIDPDAARGRRPHEFSGGQCQRISIARAVVTEPKLIICDEPVSALDVSVQAQIINLLQDMKDRYGLTLVFIAHDLAVVKNVSDRVAVMYLGQAVRVRAARRALRARRCTRTPPRCSRRSRCPTRPSGRRTARRSRARSRRRSHRRAGAGSGPAARRPRRSAPRRSRWCARSGPDSFAACHFPLEPGEELDFTRGEAAQVEAEVTSSV